MKKICSVCVIIFLLVIASNYAQKSLNKSKTVQIKAKEVGVVKDIKQLNEEDFSVKYNEIGISLGDNPKEFFEKNGLGTAKEENNYGFIGWDDKHENKMYLHGYTEESPQFDIITKSNTITGEVIVNQIDLISSKTVRNIGKGSTRSDIFKSYGKPTKEGKNTIQYIYKDKKLIFNLNDNKIVEQIYMMIERKE